MLIFEEEIDDDELDQLYKIAHGVLRKTFYRWAAFCGQGGEHFRGWAQDRINWGIAVAWKDKEKWDRSYPFSKWAMLRIEEHARKDLQKRSRRMDKQDRVDEVIRELLAREPIDGLETCIKNDTIRGVVQFLSPPMRTVIALYYVVGFNDGEIARLLMMKKGTVESTRQRALTEARKYYVILHSPKTTGSAPPTPPVRRQRRPRDSTSSDGDGNDGDEDNQDSTERRASQGMNGEKQ